MVKNTRKKHVKSKHHNKTHKKMMVLKGGAWYSFFLPLLGYKSDDKKTDQDAKKPIDPAKKTDSNASTDSNVTDKETDSNVTDKETDSNVTETREPEPVVKPGKKEEKGKKNKKEEKGKKDEKNIRELYKVEKDETRMDKEFYDNPNITTWCFDDPGYKPVGIVHVTSVVGINILRSYATTVRNIVGVKGTIDENMHRLRNEIYNEMENIMEAKNIDKICGVGVAFTKDSGSLILSAFGTALRKQPSNVE